MEQICGITIACALRGHDFKNEVQVAAQVFFPGARFEFLQNVVESTVKQNKFVAKCDVLKITSTIIHRTAVAVFYKNGEEVSRAGVPVPCADEAAAEYLPLRRVVILSVYHALQKAVPTVTPWGALTGIRPSKPVRQWLASGCADDEILRRLQDPFCVSEKKARLALEVAHAERRVEARIRGVGENTSNVDQVGVIKTSVHSPSMEKIPVGVYVSIPFCPTRCVYCSFNLSGKPPNADFLQRYIAALTAEIREISARVRENGETVSSYYIGGGTPTFLPDELLEKLLDEICTSFNLGGKTCTLEDNAHVLDGNACTLDRRSPTHGVEFTLEAGRPDTLTPAKVKILQKYGITRVAVNPQTMNDHTLAAIGRAHTAADFIKAFNLVREAGFIINTDIIAGLPGECLDDMRRNMDTLARLAPENITVHTLAIKRASRLNEPPSGGHRREHIVRAETSSQSRFDFQIPKCTPNDAHHHIEDMLKIAANACTDAGLLPYYLYRQKNMAALLENVGYALPGTECLYNVGMMAEVQTILAAGAGAVSKFIDGDKITRKFNPKDPAIYITRQKDQLLNVNPNEEENF